MGFSGVYGSILASSVNIIFLFIIFGALIQVTGTDRFFFEMGKLVGGRLRSGAANTSVIGSSLMGMVVGTVSVNILVTGTLTIPLMKKAGYTSEQAGAIEGASSTGGQIMPPVMGSVAFVMAGFTGLSYRDIMIAALLPALLYYFSIGVGVQLIAVKQNISPMPGRIDIREILLGGPYLSSPSVSL